MILEFDSSNDDGAGCHRLSILFEALHQSKDAWVGLLHLNFAL